MPTSRLVSYLTGFVVQPNKAIVGRNAFAHESGIHQDGVLKNPLNFEIMTPQSVGLTSNQLTIGKLSGRRGLQGKLHDLGYDLDGEALDEVYRQAIDLADAKKEVTDADLLALVEQRSSGVPSSIALVGWSVTSSHGGNATGTATIDMGGEERTAETTGNGPVNALFRAVDEAVQPVLGWHPTLTEYEIKAVTAGEDAQGQVLVRCRRSSDEGPGALIVTGHGLSTNIIEASLEAYVVAVNKLHGAEINGVSVAFASPRSGRIDPVSDGRGLADRTASRPSPAMASGRRSSRRRAGSSTRPVSARLRHRLVGAPRRRRRHRRVRGRHPRRGPGRLRGGGRDPARRRRRTEVVRPGRGGPARAGALRPAWRPRPVRQPPAGDRPPGPGRGVAAPPGAARRASTS